jgi:hypothetical protein
MLPRSTLEGLTWRQPVVFVLATIVCTLLAIYAVVLAPVDSVAGVSGLYFAAAIYVPLALWFGIWGCLAGYLSCIFMGLYLGYSLPFVMVWGLADFFEGFIPLLIYRSIKNKPALTLKHPNITYGANIFLAVILFGSALALVFAQSTVFLATSIVGIALLLFQAYVEDRQTWITWLIVGVFIASVVSGIFGVGALAAFGYVPMAVFPSALYGWVLGDIVVLSTLGTIITVLVTPKIMKSSFYVRRYFS